MLLPVFWTGTFRRRNRLDVQLPAIKSMCTKYTILFLTYFTLAFGQTSQLDKIETEIRKTAYEGRFDKNDLDLNNDGTNDMLYLYQCGEPSCVKVFLNIGGLYKEQVSEQFTAYNLMPDGNKRLLYLRLKHCCGESPYVSNRVFEFGDSSASLKENYVLTNFEYIADTRLLMPTDYLPNAYSVKITADNYNMRFSPSTEKLSGKMKELFTYACEDGTNIIAKIKIGSTIKVLSERVEKNMKWLFVEIEKNTIAGSCNPIDFDFKDQKLRGWVSDEHVEKQ